ncbi:MAG TPA: hypothetical protein VFU96_02285 [Acidimicrobiia bacterium]|nr:hypothetical protein [Acidimicrobiia bacterium]
MRRRQKEALRRMGIETENYYVNAWPPTWGIALMRDGEDFAVVESHGDHVDEQNRHLRGKYVIRDRRATGPPHLPGGEWGDADLGAELGVYRRQGDALLAATQMRPDSRLTIRKREEGE